LNLNFDYLAAATRSSCERTNLDPSPIPSNKQEGLFSNQDQACLEAVVLYDVLYATSDTNAQQLTTISRGFNKQASVSRNFVSMVYSISCNPSQRRRSKKSKPSKKVGPLNLSTTCQMVGLTRYW